MSITVVGTVALDNIETPVGKRDNIFGGSAFHFSNAASKLTQVNLVAIVGRDYPQKGYDFLHGMGVDTSGIAVHDSKLTFSWSGKYEHDMGVAITLATNLNALEEFNPVIPDSYKNDDYLFLANIDPDLQIAVLDQMKYKKAAFLDTMNFWITGKLERLMEAIKRVEGVFLNDQEIRLITGEISIIKGARKLLQLGPDYVIIKKGEHGVVLITKENYAAMPSFPIEDLVDPTGAGDSFAGATLGYLDKIGELSFENLRDALSYATVLASFTVQGFGYEALVKASLENIKERFLLYRKYISVPDKLQV